MFSDERIRRLLQERKPLIDARAVLTTFQASDPKHGHRRGAVQLKGASGTDFAVHLRQSVFDAYDFSVILLFEPINGPPVVLRRHNGRGHPHRNRIEDERLPSTFHVHVATERYQREGLPIDGYAETTEDFADLATALDAMLRVANFETPAQGTLLE